MKEIMGKSFIMIGCLCLMVCRYPVDTESILAFLIAIIISYADFILIANRQKKDTVQDSLRERYLLFFDIISTLYVTASFFHPCFFCFIPLINYAVGRFRYKLTPALSVISCVYFVYHHQSFLPVMLIILTALGIYTSYMEKKSSDFEYALILQRDNSVEHDMLIEENNRQIIANQNNLIYMATLKERNRIAREIHDNVGHMLTRSILQVGAIATINKDDRLNVPLTNLQDTLNTAMTNIRTSVHDLHDESIDLKTSIEALTSDISKFHITVDYDMGSVIPRDIKYAFISVTKEAVNNAVKHSNCDFMSIILREHPGFYQLMISDNGTNIHINDTGIGLSGMAERIKALDGTIKISTEHGFNILISVMKKGEHK